MEILDIEISPYHALLIDLENELPAFRNNIYILSDQTHIESKTDLDEDTQELLENYYLLQYDITTGNNYAEELGFFNR